MSGQPTRSGKDVPAIVELLVNQVDLGSGGGEAGDSLCEKLATCHFGFTVYNAQPLKCVGFYGDDRHSALLEGGAIAKSAGPTLFVHGCR